MRFSKRELLGTGYWYIKLNDFISTSGHGLGPAWQDINSDPRELIKDIPHRRDEGYPMPYAYYMAWVKEGRRIEERELKRVALP